MNKQNKRRTYESLELFKSQHILLRQRPPHLFPLIPNHHPHRPSLDLTREQITTSLVHRMQTLALRFVPDTPPLAEIEVQLFERETLFRGAQT